VIDCHAHLASPRFDDDRAEVLSRAAAVGVELVVVVGEDASEAERVLEVCAAFPRMLRPCVGLHPDRWADDRTPPSQEDLEVVCDLARTHRDRLCAIGEVGLDWWAVRSHERRALQRAALERLAALAIELELPLSVHARSAGRHAIETLAGVGARRVLMHAFDGRAGHALRAWEAHGWTFSIPPSVVRSKQKQKLARALPLEALALESDSPALGPERGERNEPANLVRSVEQIARHKRIDEATVREVTTANARRLFGQAAAPLTG